MVSLRERKRPASQAADEEPEPPKRGRKAKVAKAEPNSEDDSVDASQSKPATKAKGKAKVVKPETGSDEDAANNKKGNKGKAAVKSEPELDTNGEDAAGGAQFAKADNLLIPVDEACNLGSNYRVYVDSSDGIIYDAALNQTNAGDNANKFYKIQLLTNGANDFRTWTRWGRVGENGQSALLGTGPLDDAMKHFDKKFKDKSGLSWADRGKPPKPKKYVFVERSYEPETEEEEEEGDGHAQKGSRSRSKSPVKCTLDVPVKSLMELIFNEQYLNSTMADLNYDAKKLPLGKLSKNTITRGYQTLKELETLLNDPGLAQSEYGTKWSEAVETLSNRYYSYIPHAFGRNRPPIIDDHIALQREVTLLDSLTDLKDSDSIAKDNKAMDDLHPLNQRFNGLNLREMSPVDQNTAEFTNISDYLTKTKGSTHGISYEVQDIFRIERDGETERYEKYAKANSDRRLLWHGSRSTNYGGILSQGLRIAPPEAPASGYMFGKGVYLADMSSKSANYCCPGISGGHALLLLCEAELGNPMQELTNAAYNAGDDAQAKGLFSTWGKGLTGPAIWKDAACIHPSLKGVQMPDTKDAPGDTKIKGACLLYNEYICYDVAQVRLRYLMRVKMW